MWNNKKIKVHNTHAIAGITEGDIITIEQGNKPHLYKILSVNDKPYNQVLFLNHYWIFYGTNSKTNWEIIEDVSTFIVGKWYEFRANNLVNIGKVSEITEDHLTCKDWILRNSYMGLGSWVRANNVSIIRELKMEDEAIQKYLPDGHVDKLSKVCEDCNGKGTVMVGKLYPSGHTEVDEVCSKCDGNGYIDEALKSKEPAFPKCVECLTTVKGQYTKGKIYKNNSNSDTKIYRTDVCDNGNPNGFGIEQFKPSTEEAYNLQNTPSKPVEKPVLEDLAGRWVKWVKPYAGSTDYYGLNIGEYDQITTGNTKEGNLKKFCSYNDLLAYFELMPIEWTPEEAKEDLLEEAKRRFPKGTRFTNSNIVPSYLSIVRVKGDWKFNTNISITIMSDTNSSFTIYKDGRWAEILQDYLEPSSGTKEELIRMAKEKGFVAGARFIDLVNYAEFTVNSTPTFDGFSNAGQLYISVNTHPDFSNKTARIYKNGTWATIISTPAFNIPKIEARIEELKKPIGFVGTKIWIGNDRELQAKIQAKLRELGSKDHCATYTVGNHTAYYFNNGLISGITHSGSRDIFNKSSLKEIFPIDLGIAINAGEIIEKYGWEVPISNNFPSIIEQLQVEYPLTPRQAFKKQTFNEKEWEQQPFNQKLVLTNKQKSKTKQKLVL